MTQNTNGQKRTVRNYDNIPTMSDLNLHHPKKFHFMKWHDGEYFTFKLESENTHIEVCIFLSPHELQQMIKKILEDPEIA